MRNPKDAGAPGPDLHLTVMILLAAVMLQAWYGGASHEPVHPDSTLNEAACPTPPQEAASGVDPNLAPWWELTVLPGIGQTKAREIVAYRESALRTTSAGVPSPVFRRAADLDKVHGIGSAIVQRISQELRFDEPDHEVPSAVAP